MCEHIGWDNAFEQDVPVDMPLQAQPMSTVQQQPLQLFHGYMKGLQETLPAVMGNLTPELAESIRQNLLCVAYQLGENMVRPSGMQLMCIGCMQCVASWHQSSNLAG